MRDVAGHDYQKALRVQCWPLHDVLETYLHLMKKHAMDNYCNDYLHYLLSVPVSKRRLSPPKKPQILKD